MSQDGGVGIGGFECGVEDLPGVASFRHRTLRMALTAREGRRR
jgi:hypothetical protein